MPFNPLGRVLAMTRETKLGLVVSGSFLGLLAVVLALKMTEAPEDTQGADVATVAQTEKPDPTPPAERSTRPGETATPGEEGKPTPPPALSGDVTQTACATTGRRAARPLKAFPPCRVARPG